MWYSAVSMTKKTYLSLAIRCFLVYHNEHGAHNLKQRKTGNQGDRFTMAVIICSVCNNKTTVCHLAIPREISRLLWHGEEIECEVTGRQWGSHSKQIEDYHA